MQQPTMSRYYRVGEWLYEVKSVRAMRVPQYGMPYTATANFSFNAEQAFVEGYLVRTESSKYKQDWQSFYEFSRIMGAESVNYQRFHRGVLQNKKVKITENCETSSDSLAQMAV